MLETYIKNPQLNKLHEAFLLCPSIKEAFETSDNIEEIREKLYKVTCELEYNLVFKTSSVHSLERINVKNAIRVFRNFLNKRNEEITGYSFIKTLLGILRKNNKKINNINPAFTEEVYHIIKGMTGKSGMYLNNKEYSREENFEYLHLKGRNAAIARSKFLDKLSSYCDKYIKRYKSGLDDEIIIKRQQNVKRILKYLKGEPQDWLDYKWHMKNVIKDSKTLMNLIDLTKDEIEAIDKARKKEIPFGITPYYVSLMDRESHRKYDHAVRAQVIPPISYVDKFECLNRKEMDFMLEYDTSPIDLITRRYPRIAILKPINTCTQICVYCQRNWMIKEVNSPDAIASLSKINEAIEWFRKTISIKSVLITGGDPLILCDKRIDDLLKHLSQIPHIKSIRIGTRTPVVLPFRFTDSLVEIFKKYHIPSKKEICIVTHFEHPYEVSLQALEAIQKVKSNTGINFYNQQVFTIENCRRFETSALRIAIKNIGVDPYYTFHAKGKKETEYYIVPISRLIQERKEEARLLPGIVRTDEPVYNIPGLGKNYLRAPQHELIMLTPQGHRLYEMHPWEKGIIKSNTYIYKDVPILTFLKRLEAIGENLKNYNSIWYYY